MKKQTQLSLFNLDKAPMFPNELKQQEKTIQHKNFTLHTRPWTKEEEDWAWELHVQGYNYTQIAISLDRENSSSVPIKMKRLKKEKNLYNDKHKEDKYYNNTKFLIYMGNKIRTVLDCFCGEKQFYNNKGYTVHNNDINKFLDVTTNLDANVLLDNLIQNNIKFDMVDLDPYGASIIYLDKALQVSTRGLIMTLGELGHKRWKRLDFISKYYNITKVEDINLNIIIDEIIKKAKEKNIILKPIIIADYNTIGRVWFEIM